ncbi:MAG: histidine phosphatase family protein [Tepidiformaceae bacterium]
MARGLILVRHAMPEVVPGLSSTLWRLGAPAREDCVLLAHALPAGLAPAVISSGQPKVDETAAIIALRGSLTTKVDGRMREVDQPDAWYEGDYRTLAACYLAGDEPAGWEPRDAVAARFSAAAAAALAQPGEGDAVIVNHGLALSLYLATLAPTVRSADGLAAFDLVPFWRALTFPDAWRLDPATGTLERVFHAGLAPD